MLRSILGSHRYLWLLFSGNSLVQSLYTMIQKDRVCPLKYKYNKNVDIKFSVHDTLRFCNNLHQVRSELKDWKVNKNVDI
jgi:hypothetical protein